MENKKNTNKLGESKMKGSGANKANTVQTPSHTYSHPLDLSAVAKTKSYFFHLLLFFFFFLLFFLFSTLPLLVLPSHPSSPFIVSLGFLLNSTAHSTPKSFFIHLHPLSPLLYIFSLFLLSFSHTLHNVWHPSFGCFLKINPSQAFHLGALRRNSPPCHPSKVRLQDRHTLLGPD